ncbi:DUF6504 family protein [Nocardioides rubriscoriae]|uniref:DUF6504 family protein n=1 Tax=Nocardioides rubriscoriae TaxID=642762 RepID=UPI0011DF8880|nr:DUF6504 family protein [Nocardioides rubriscoriae]
MRRYDDPVEVRRCAPGESDGPELGPEQFLWRGRLWKVRAVLARWVETGSWWHGDDVRAVLGTDRPHDQPHDRPHGGAEAGDIVVAPARDLLRERELWRVRAGRGGLESDGVFELSYDGSDGSWQLVGCED